MLASPFLAVFDFFAMSTVAPLVWQRLNGSGQGADLVLAAFSTAYAAGLVTGGVLGDRYGTRRLFTLGMAGYLAACAVCAAAPDTAVLLGGRVLQGIAAAAMLPQAFAVTAGTGPKAYSQLAATLGAASVAGQLLAAISVAAGISWRALFAVEIAVAAVILAASRRLPASPLADKRIDAVGLVLGVLVPLSVLAPLTFVRLTGANPLILLSAVAAIPLERAYRRRMRRVFSSRKALLAAVGTGVAYAGQSVLLLVAAVRPHGNPLIPVGYGASFAFVSLLRPAVQATIIGPLLAVLFLAVLCAAPRVFPLMFCGAVMGLVLPRLTREALDGAVPGAASGTLATIQQSAAAAAVTVAAWFL